MLKSHYAIIKVLFTLILFSFHAKASNSWSDISTNEYHEKLVDCQIKIKQFEWSKTTWPKENNSPKPSFDEVVDIENIERQVYNSLLIQNILAEQFKFTVNFNLIQNDINRMVRDSKDQKSLKELFNTLENDPQSIGHCISRPYLIKKNILSKYYLSKSIHSETKIKSQLELKKYLINKSKNRLSAQITTHSLELNHEENEQVEGNISPPAENIIKLDSEEFLSELDRLRKPALQERETFYIYSEIIDQSSKSIKIQNLIWEKQKINDWLNNQYLKTNITRLLPMNYKGLNIPKIIAESNVTKNINIPQQTGTWNYSNIPEGRRGHTAVWTGTEMIIWGGYYISGRYGSNRNYLNSGSRYNPSTDSWIRINQIGSPIGRSNHTAIWTGLEMIVWGGLHKPNDFEYLNSGAKYSPNTDNWSAISNINAPSIRAGYSTIWTGAEMIIWGGSYRTNSSDSIYLNSGASYDPVTDNWTATRYINAPTVRTEHSAVWTGNEMIIWGGYNGDHINSGGSYNLNSESWSTISDFTTSEFNIPINRSYHKAIWTGNEMIIWGGHYENENNERRYPIIGGIYKPNIDIWTTMNINHAPVGRLNHSSIWTGSEMIIWGGYTNDPDPYIFSIWLDNGGRYNPTTDIWTSITSDNSPIGRSGHSSIWTGSEMIIWGGSDPNLRGDIYLKSGARYNPTSNDWVATNSSDAQIPRGHHTAIWTGYEMITWGGVNFNNGSSNELNTGSRYNPITDSFLSTSLVGAPNARRNHSAVWTGTEMIVWGGYYYENSAQDSIVYLNNGSKYNPVNDTWLEVNNINDPTKRIGYTAIWTGTEMIIWGGRSPGFNYLNSGTKYNPTSNIWSLTNNIDAPIERAYHTSLWTGSEMIVWGGYSGSNVLNTGGIYSPNMDSWTNINNNNAPTASDSTYTSIWTGTEMIVWGGRPYDEGLTSGKYNPAYDIWTDINTIDAPRGRMSHTSIWTGNEMIVWGGYYFNNYEGSTIVNSGGVYDPKTDSWSPTNIAEAPISRFFHTSVWTGNEMIVFGGYDGNWLSSMGMYYPYGPIQDMIFNNGFEEQ